MALEKRKRKEAIERERENMRRETIGKEMSCNCSTTSKPKVKDHP